MQTGNIELLNKEIVKQNERINIIEQKVLTEAQFKAEMVKDYITIIEQANGGLSNQITWTNGLIATVSVLVPIVVACIGLYFRNLFLKIEESISNTNKEIEKKEEQIKSIEQILESKLLEIKNIEESISSQDERIYKNIIETLTNYWFDRLLINPDDRKKLEIQITVLDEHIVRQRIKNYEILLNLKDIDDNIHIKIFQFFPDILFQEKKITNWVSDSKKGMMMNYISEMIFGTKLIFEKYKSNSNTGLKEELKKYLKFIYDDLITNNIRQYTVSEKNELLSYIDIEIKKVGEEELRTEIKSNT